MPTGIDTAYMKKSVVKAIASVSGMRSAITSPTGRLHCPAVAEIAVQTAL